MNALKEALAYRLGSMILSGTIAFVVLGEIRVALLLGSILFVTQTLYYVAFRRFWASRRPKVRQHKA